MHKIKLGIERLFEGADIAGGLDRVIGELEVRSKDRTFSVDTNIRGRHVWLGDTYQVHDYTSARNVVQKIVRPVSRMEFRSTGINQAFGRAISISANRSISGSMNQ